MSAEVGLQHYLLLGAVLFVCGAMCMATKRNAIGILMGVELILNAANVNLVSFNRFAHGGSAGSPVLGGQVFAIFVIAVAAAEAAVGLGIILAFYRNKESVNIDEMNLMRW